MEDKLDIPTYINSDTILSPHPAGYASDEANTAKLRGGVCGRLGNSVKAATAGSYYKTPRANVIFGALAEVVLSQIALCG